MTHSELSFMFVGHETTRSHTNLSDLCCHLRPCDVWVHAATEGQVYIHGLNVARCVLMFMTNIAPECQVDVGEFRSHIDVQHLNCFERLFRVCGSISTDIPVYRLC